MVIFEFLRELVAEQDNAVLFILALIAMAMVIDFVTGTAKAKVLDVRTSKAGINGIIRKISSIILLVFFIPVSVLIPANAGTALLYVLYVGYLINELTSIIENLNEMGSNTDGFSDFLKKLLVIGKSDEEGGTK